MLGSRLLGISNFSTSAALPADLVCCSLNCFWTRTKRGSTTSTAHPTLVDRQHHFNLIVLKGCCSCLRCKRGPEEHNRGPLLMPSPSPVQAPQ